MRPQAAEIKSGAASGKRRSIAPRRAAYWSAVRDFGNRAVAFYPSRKYPLAVIAAKWIHVYI